MNKNGTAINFSFPFSGNLTNIKTRSIVPVDLNALLYWNAELLSEFYELLNDSEKASDYKNKAQTWLETVTNVLWHEEVGSWLDYDMSNSMKRDYFYMSNLVPLFTGCYDKNNQDKIVPLVLNYLKNKNIMIYPGGVPTSFEHTGEQWDYPNAWPPLQHMLIVGLSNTDDLAAQRLAFEIAEKWVRSNYQAYNDTTHMYEKVRGNKSNIKKITVGIKSNSFYSTTLHNSEATEPAANTTYNSVSVGAMV